MTGDSNAHHRRSINHILVKHFKLSRVYIDIPYKIDIQEIAIENQQKLVQAFYNDFNFTGRNKALLILTMQFIQNFIRDTIEECLQELKGLIQVNNMFYVPGSRYSSYTTE